ncbi:MAG: MFS transporter [Chloroflexi bacterium]|nr:MFS transporter [Chloroflexota bacterium]
MNNSVATVRARDVLRNRSFRNLLIGQFVSNVGDGLIYLSLVIMLNRLFSAGGAEGAIGFLMICQAAPRVIFGLLSGVYVDRLDRKQLMIITDVARGVIVLTCLLVNRPEEVWIYYASAALLSALSSVFGPARNASLPHLVNKEQLLVANTLSQTSFIVALTLGTASAGLLIGAFDSVMPAIVVDAISFFVSAAFIAALPLPHAPHHARPDRDQRAAQVWAELKEGLHFLAHQRSLVGAMLGFTLTMLGLGAINVLFVPFMVNDLGMDEAYVGLVDLTQMLGMVAVNLFIAKLVARFSTAQIFGLGMLGLGASIAAAGWVQAAWVLFPLSVAWGITIAPVQASASTIVQSVPDHIRGRTGSATETVVGVANVVSMALAGFAGSAIGVRNTFMLGGLIAGLGGVVAWWLMREVKPALDRSSRDLELQPAEVAALPDDDAA